VDARRARDRGRRPRRPRLHDLGPERQRHLHQRQQRRGRRRQPDLLGAGQASPSRPPRASTSANNLVTDSGEWGIHVDNGDPPPPAAIDGNVVAFNTVYGNGHGAAGTGGIRFQNATGEIRDNVVVANVGAAIRTDKAPTNVHHNSVFGSATAFATTPGQEPALWANVAADPLLNDPPSATSRSRTSRRASRPTARD